MSSLCNRGVKATSRLRRRAAQLCRHSIDLALLVEGSMLAVSKLLSTPDVCTQAYPHIVTTPPPELY
jgi:hypothetical protein